MGNPKQKGNALEYAVHQIEEVLMSKFPQLAGENAKIEQNRIFEVDGVRHEADLWITVAPSTPYEAYHIIECKNWKKPVGSAEIDKLKNKRDRLGASQALLVARSFTRDATNLAKGCKIKLLVASEDLWPSISEIRGIGTTLEFARNEIRLRFRNPNARSGGVQISHETECKLFGLIKTLEDLAVFLVRERLNRDPVKSDRLALEGLHHSVERFGCEFGRNELVVDNEEVTHLDIDCEYSLQVYNAQMTVRFAVEGRGSFFRFEFPKGAFDNESTVLEFVTAAKKPIK